MATRCCSRCLKHVPVTDGQAWAFGKVFHLACTRYNSKGVADVHGPLATDDIQVDYWGRVTLWRAGNGYYWGNMSEFCR